MEESTMGIVEAHENRQHTVFPAMKAFNATSLWDQAEYRVQQ